MALWNCTSCGHVESNLYQKNVTKLKVILLGNSGVGKTALLNCLNCNEFVSEHLTTIGVEFMVKTFDIDGEIVRAKMWDTAGQHRYGSVMITFYKKANGVIFVYDVTDRESFAALDMWKKEFMRHHDASKVCMIVVANKCEDDVESVVTTEEGREWADKNHMLFAETSAKGGVSVIDMFNRLLQRITKERAKAKAHQSTFSRENSASYRRAEYRNRRRSNPHGSNGGDLVPTHSSSSYHTAPESRRKTTSSFSGFFSFSDSTGMGLK